MKPLSASWQVPWRQGEDKQLLKSRSIHVNEMLILHTSMASMEATCLS